MRYLIECILSVIYYSDDKCIVCSDTLVQNQDLICSRCVKDYKLCEDELYIESLKTRFKYYSAAYYSGIVREFIVRLKYKADFRSGEILASLMQDVISKRNLKYDIISFVPMSRSAFRKRGYNQSEYLAKVIGRTMDIPVKACLIKHSETKDQIGLNAESRWENLSGCFKTVSSKRFSGKTVLLIDDVITTGATAFYCSKQLIDSGAHEVIILTAAKSRL